MRCGLQLRRLSTLQGASYDAAASPIAPFAAGRPPLEAARVVRELAVEGWALYWTAEAPAPAGVDGDDGGSSGETASAAAAAAAGGVQQAPAAGDYIVPPVSTVMRIAVLPPPPAAAAAGAALAVDVLVGASDVALRVDARQLAGAARLADAAAVWQRRNRFGRFRPSGWRTVGQIAGGWAACCGAGGSAAGAGGAGKSEGGARLVPAARAGLCAPVTWAQVWRYAADAVIEGQRAERAGGSGGVLAKRDGPARRRYMDLYRRRLEQLQRQQQAQQQQQQQPEQAAEEAPAEQQQPDESPLQQEAGAAATAAPQPAPAGPEPSPPASRAASSADLSAAAATARPKSARATPAPPERCGAGAPLAAEEERELSLLEVRLAAPDILLARALAEAALERQAGASDAERRRSWFAWGAAALAAFAPSPYYGGGAAAAAAGGGPGGARRAAAAAAAAAGAYAPGALLPGMPTDSDLDELYALLDAGQDEALIGGGHGGSHGGGAGAPRAAPAAGGLDVAVSCELRLLSASAELRAAATVADGGAAAAAPTLLALRAVDVRVGGAAGADGGARARLSVQDVQLIDHCSDPGVEEVVFGRLDADGAPARLCGLQHAAADGGGGGVQLPLIALEAERPCGHLGAADAGFEWRAALRLQRMQLLARPACAAAIREVAALLPADTLAARLEAAELELRLGGARVGGVEAEHPVWLPKVAAVALTVDLDELVALAPAALHCQNGPHVLLHVRGVRARTLPASGGDDGNGGGGEARASLDSRTSAPGMDAGDGGDAQGARPAAFSRYSFEIDSVALHVGGAAAGAPPLSPPAAAVASPVAAQLPPLSADVHLLRRLEDAFPSAPQQRGAAAGAAATGLPLARVRARLPAWQLVVRGSHVEALRSVAAAMAEQADPWRRQAAAAPSALQTAPGIEQQQQEHDPEEAPCPASPTASEVERWMAAPPTLAAPSGSCEEARDAAAAEQGASAGPSAAPRLRVHQRLTEGDAALRRCDSDGWMASSGRAAAAAAAPAAAAGASGSGGGGAERQAGKHQQHQQQQQPLARRPAPCGPPVTWLAVDVETDSISIEAVADRPAAPGESPFAGPPPALHARARLAGLQLHHSLGSHGDSLAVALRGLEAEDLVAAPPAAPTLKRLARSLVIQDATVCVGSRLGCFPASAAAANAGGGGGGTAAAAEATLLAEGDEESSLSVAVAGLELRGFEDEPGVFLLPARRGGAPARVEYRQRAASRPSPATSSSPRAASGGRRRAHGAWRSPSAGSRSAPTCRSRSWPPSRRCRQAVMAARTLKTQSSSRRRPASRRSSCRCVLRPARCWRRRPTPPHRPRAACPPCRRRRRRLRRSAARSRAARWSTFRLCPCGPAAPPASSSSTSSRCSRRARCRCCCQSRR